MHELNAWSVLVQNVRIREENSNIPHGSCAQQRIANSMQHNVRIRMTRKPSRIRNLDAAQPKLSSLRKLVYVIAKSSPDFRTVGSSLCLQRLGNSRQIIRSSNLDIRALALNYCHLNTGRLQNP